MVTWANDHYFDFVMNWVLHLRRLNVTNHLVGAMDDQLLQRLVAADVPTWSMQSGLTTNDFGWGTPTFHKMGRSKIGLIHDFVSMVRPKVPVSSIHRSYQTMRRGSTYLCQTWTRCGCGTPGCSCCATLKPTS